MRDYLLQVCCDIMCAFLIIICGREALETSSLLISIVCWLGVYILLDLHVYLTNSIKEEPKN